MTGAELLFPYEKTPQRIILACLFFAACCIGFLYQASSNHRELVLNGIFTSPLRRPTLFVRLLQQRAESSFRNRPQMSLEIHCFSSPDLGPRIERENIFSAQTSA
jgi:hypothetical protein